MNKNVKPTTPRCGICQSFYSSRDDDGSGLWSSAISPGEQNRAYRLLIDRIVYDREDNGVTLEVLYK